MGKREACEGDMWTRTESVLNSKSGRMTGGNQKRLQDFNSHAIWIMNMLGYRPETGVENSSKPSATYAHERLQYNFSENLLSRESLGTMINIPKPSGPTLNCEGRYEICAFRGLGRT